MAGDDCGGQKEAMKKRDVLFACLATVAIAAVAVAVALGPQHAKSISCGNYMSSIGLATRVWSEDNNNILPNDFVCMSNELATTKVLICPDDQSRQAAPNWASFMQSNSSYQLLTPGVPYNDTNAFLKCQIHGHLGYADGTVFDGQRRRTKVPY
jgi:hypothetical protein